MKLTLDEENVKDEIRRIFPDKPYNLKKAFRRVRFIIKELGHALTNIPVEFCQNLIGDYWGYIVGHIITYISVIVFIGLVLWILW